MVLCFSEICWWRLVHSGSTPPPTSAIIRIFPTTQKHFFPNLQHNLYILWNNKVATFILAKLLSNRIIHKSNSTNSNYQGLNKLFVTTTLTTVTYLDDLVVTVAQFEISDPAIMTEFFVLFFVSPGKCNFV